MTPFRMTTKFDLAYLLGRKARTAVQLLEHVRDVPAMSVYYHTHRFLHQHHYLSPEPPNDFAYWVTNVLNEEALGERIASIDIVQFTDLESIRHRFTTILEEWLTTADRVIECPQGEEFHFMSCRTFTLATPHTATNLREFLTALQEVSINSIYYHMYDARLRPELGVNDFSVWLRDIGYPGLAEKINALDPYTHTLEGLRRAIITLVESHDAD